MKLVNVNKYSNCGNGRSNWNVIVLPFAVTPNVLTAALPAEI
ncbi:MAG: hypothetical protein Q611_LSC00339G0001 [Leuconostoc sp. DORA_2]|nr:MAG: hypothetical protein Q611_LSC00339G0001 [Leuconostoc sp. DORA_2]